jgi:hypothetical protein
MGLRSLRRPIPFIAPKLKPDSFCWPCSLLRSGGDFPEWVARSIWCNLHRLLSAVGEPALRWRVSTRVEGWLPISPHLRCCYSNQRGDCRPASLVTHWGRGRESGPEQSRRSALRWWSPRVGRQFTGGKGSSNFSPDSDIIATERQRSPSRTHPPSAQNPTREREHYRRTRLVVAAYVAVKLPFSHIRLVRVSRETLVQWRFSRSFLYCLRLAPLTHTSTVCCVNCWYTTI